MTKTDKKNIKLKIYEKAAQYLFKYGLKGWNMDQLAAETGMAKNTLYKIIGYKKDMIQEIFDKKINDIYCDLKKVLKSNDNYFIKYEKLAKIILNMVRYTETRQARDVFLEYPAIEKTVKNIKEKFNSEIIDFLKFGIKNGYLKGCYTVDLYFEMIESFAFYYVKETDISSPEDKLNQLFEVLRVGIKS